MDHKGPVLLKAFPYHDVITSNNDYTAIVDIFVDVNVRWLTNATGRYDPSQNIGIIINMHSLIIPTGVGLQAITLS